MKFFASDLDHTIIFRGSGITQKARDAVKKLVENGYEFIAVSGRVSSSVRYFAKDLKTNYYIIANNGAIILDKEDNIVYHSPISKETLKNLFALAKKHNIEFQMYNRDTYHAKSFYFDNVKHLKNEDGSFVVNFEIRDDIEDYVLENDIDIYKFFMYNDDENILEFLEDAKEIEEVEITRSGKNSLDIMNKGVSKGKALEELMKIINPESKFIVSIGDYNNDISMIEYADFGIAMGNGVDELKMVSDFITDSIEDDGFIKAVDLVIEKFKEI